MVEFRLMAAGHVIAGAVGAGGGGGGGGGGGVGEVGESLPQAMAITNTRPANASDATCLGRAPFFSK